MADKNADLRARMEILPVVREALRLKKPVVALESAVITHGLPNPRNIDTALAMERIVADEGATAATIAVIEGMIHIGLTEPQLRSLGQIEGTMKLGIRDLASAMVKKATGGTTVAATMFAASMAGIRVFATGGIGGVHRENASDVSADLSALAEQGMIVVSAGAKAILDLPTTLERLESMSVPLIGFRTNEFPAFYSSTSGLEVSAKLDSVDQIADYWEAHRALGMKSCVLVANPPPEANALPQEEVNTWIEQASAEALKQGVHGKALTPFLLERLGRLSNGRTIDTNVALLKNNALLAAQLAVALARRERPKESGI